MPNNRIFISFIILTNVETEKCFFSGFTAFLIFFSSPLTIFCSYLLNILITHITIYKGNCKNFYALGLLSPGFTSMYWKLHKPHYATLWDIADWICNADFWSGFAYAPPSIIRLATGRSGGSVCVVKKMKFI